MEIVTVIIMLLVVTGFVLRLSYHKAAGMAAVSLVPAAFAALSYEAASGQSKTQIADWLMQPELMLDMAVVLTVDVALQICFCVLMADKIAGRMGRWQKLALGAVYWFPGLLIFPTLFALVVELIFAMPGADFEVVGLCTGGGFLLAMPAAALGVKWLLPEKDLRLELLFMVSLLTAALGVVATVNGRTAAEGTNSPEYAALGAVAALVAAGVAAGYLINKRITNKKISKLQ